MQDDQTANYELLASRSSGCPHWGRCGIGKEQEQCSGTFHESHSLSIRDQRSQSGKKNMERKIAFGRDWQCYSSPCPQLPDCPWWRPHFPPLSSFWPSRIPSAFLTWGLFTCWCLCLEWCISRSLSKHLLFTILVSNSHIYSSSWSFLVF